MTLPIANVARPRFSSARRVPLGGGSDMLFLSGVICRDADAVDNIELQTQRVFDRIISVLNDNAAGLSDIVKTTSYLTDLADYDGFNQARMAVFAGCETPPASTAVGVQTLLGAGTRIEIEVVAVVTRNRPAA